jgi:hypothetical protein
LEWLPGDAVVEAAFEDEVNFAGITAASFAPFGKGEERAVVRDSERGDTEGVVVFGSALEKGTLFELHGGDFPMVLLLFPGFAGYNTIMRFFNTTGPCNPTDHYMLPATARLDVLDIARLLRQKAYFLLNATSR